MKSVDPDKNDGIKLVAKHLNIILKKSYLISGFSGTRPGLFFLRRLSKPLDSFSGKGGISSSTLNINKKF